MFPARHPARGSEIGVGPACLGGVRGRRHGDPGGGGVCGEDRRGGVAGQGRVAADHQVLAVARESLAERREAFRRRDAFDRRQVEVASRRRVREHALVEDRLRDLPGKVAGAPRGGPAHRLLDGVAVRGLGLGQFAGREPVLERAPQLLLTDRERGGPLVRLAGQVYRGLPVDPVTLVD